MYYYSEFLYICSVVSIIELRDKYRKKYDKATTHEKRNRESNRQTARRERTHSQCGHPWKERHRNGKENPHNGCAQLWSD